MRLPSLKKISAWIRQFINFHLTWHVWIKGWEKLLPQRNQCATWINRPLMTGFSDKLHITVESYNNPVTDKKNIVLSVLPCIDTVSGTAPQHHAILHVYTTLQIWGVSVFLFEKIIHLSRFWLTYAFCYRASHSKMLAMEHARHFHITFTVKKATIHQVTTMLTTSKKSYFQVITFHFNYNPGTRVIIKVSGH